MIIIGITGGIGSGKSIISKLLRTMEYPVYDSDSEAKKIMHSDPQVTHELRQAFGDSLFANGYLDTRCLARKVFSDTTQLRLLNSIVHPAVKRHFHLWTARQCNPIVFFESAILFESGFECETDKVILITAPLEERITRVMHRDRCTREQVMQRIDQQWTEEDKAQQSDFIIVNDGVHSIIKQTETIIAKLM
jgi:dephospho-CoA kinase